MQDAELKTSRHIAFAPHGDGWQGFNGASGVSAKIERRKLFINKYQTQLLYMFNIFIVKMDEE